MKRILLFLCLFVYLGLISLPVYSQCTKVNILRVFSPNENDCVDTSHILSVVIKNEGKCKQTNVNISGTIVTGTTVRQSYSRNIDIDTGVTDTIRFKITTYPGALFASAIIKISGNVALNPTDTVTLKFRGAPTLPSVLDNSRCGPGRVILTVTNLGGDRISWYDDASSNTPISNNISFTTPFLVANKTYYVDANNTRSESVGAKHNKVGNRATANTPKGYGLRFTALTDGSLDSVYVYPAFTGNRYLRIDLFDVTDNKLVNTVYRPVSVSNIGDSVRIYLGIPFNNNSTNGTKNYSLTIGNDSSALLYNTSGGSFTYSTINNIIDIPGNAGAGATNSQYYFFYNIKVTNVGCYTSKIPVVARVNYPPTGSGLSKGTPFNGIFKSGTLSVPDTICVRQEVRYNIITPSTYSLSNYKTNWRVYDRKVTLRNGTKLPDTAFVDNQTGSGVAPYIAFKPGVNVADSICIVSFRLMDVNTKCDTLLTRYIKVMPQAKPDFTFVNYCVATPYNFKSTISATGAYAYSWDFGDGSPASNQLNPTHKFNSSGKYKVILKVISHAGCEDTVSHIVDVYVKPIARMEKTLPVCQGVASALFDSSTISPNAPVKYFWYFGDGKMDSTKRNTTHIYSTHGTYNLKLVLKMNSKECTDSTTGTALVNEIPVVIYKYDSLRCPGAPINFEGLSTYKGSRLNITHNWYFPDTSHKFTSKPPAYTSLAKNFFKIKVEAVVTGANVQCPLATKEDTIFMLPSPTAKFRLSSACLQVPVVTDNRTTFSNGISAKKYEWDFGVGPSGLKSAKDTSHKYPIEGQFTIKLKVTADNGCVDTTSVNLNISQLKALIDVGKPICQNGGVLFRALKTNQFTNHIWKLNSFNTFQKDTSSLKDVLFTMNYADSYTVFLKVDAGKGCLDSATQKFKSNPLPDAGFKFNTSLARNTIDSIYYKLVPNNKNHKNYEILTSIPSRKLERKNKLDSLWLGFIPKTGKSILMLTVTDANGCKNTAIDTVNTDNLNNSIEQIKAQSFSVSIYPNPAQERLSIELISNTPQTYLIKWYSLQGKELQANQKVIVSENGLTKIQYTQTELPEHKGMYLIKIQSGNEFITKRILIN